MEFNLEEEIREGHVIAAKMKRVWKVQLDMLVLFDRFCAENGLTYFIDFGTLLGAVRHKGFIPWDDDIDVTMPRPDYQRFLEIAPKWFETPFFVQNYHTDHNDNRMTSFSRLRNDNTTMMGSAIIPNANFHQGIFIDIFPLDIAADVLDGKAAPEIISTLLELWTATFTPKDLLMEMIEGKEPKFGFDSMIEVLGMPYEERLTLLENLLASCYDSLGEINVFSKMFTTPPCKKEWYGGVVKLPFEGYEFNAPVGYHEILTARYGDYNERKMYASDHRIGILDPDRPYTEYLT
ncbi:LicD family protein [Butyrivibrio sp. FCS014]|uniref:LicD family protein n=1 Tax=Butyrivibrio sp. FCS014 TaxID=1408304 RepID=UPI000466EBE1|nr:LicD family protein [Butyrivibrio sp. FCS014]